MSVHPLITFSLVNMRKRNAVTHALLNSDTHTNLFLLQEPWFDTIGTARNDDAQQGIDVLGGVASPGWEILYPVIPKGHGLCPQVGPQYPCGTAFYSSSVPQCFYSPMCPSSRHSLRCGNMASH
jgi:hypothetical protein